MTRTASTTTSWPSSWTDDNVGARVTGSPEAQKAIDWGMAKMRGIGLEIVHAEKWQLWRGWKRGTADATYLYYTLGKLEIMKLRADMMKKQGAAFNLQQFHDSFMRQGEKYTGIQPCAISAASWFVRRVTHGRIGVKLD